jgi:hypothetical protein
MKRTVSRTTRRRAIVGLAAVFLTSASSVAGLAQNEAASPPRTCLLAGRVTAGGKPWELGEVVVRREGDAGAPRRDSTGGNGTGEFYVDGLAPGTYVVEVPAPSSDTEGHGEPLAQARVTLSPGQDRCDLELTISNTVAASGKVVDADARTPLPALVVFHPRGKQGPMFTGLAREDGSFFVEGLVPGDWVAYPQPEPYDRTDFYSEATGVTIGSDDVPNLELHLRRGSTISGTVVVDDAGEGVAPPTGEVTVRLEEFDSDLVVGAWPNASIGPDGRFTLNGLPPSTVSLIFSKPREGYDFAVTRVEGAAVIDGRCTVFVNPNDPVTEVRVHVRYGAHALRGRLRVINGRLPAGCTVSVWVVREKSLMAEAEQSSAAVSEGSFTIPRLPAGEYTLRCVVFPEGARPGIYATCQRVSIADAEDASVVVVLDLAKAGPSMPAC